MTQPDTSLIAVAFVVKHFLADFPLQPPYQWMNKGKYGHPGGLLHAAIHGAGTWIIQMLFIGNPFAPFFLVDAVIHYHVDWLKMQFKWTPDNRYFWWALGVDQMLHYLTYVLLIGWML